MNIVNMNCFNNFVLIMIILQRENLFTIFHTENYHQLQRTFQNKNIF